MIPVTQEQIREYTSKGWWGNETILDRLWQTAEKTPDHEAIVDPYNRPALVGGQAKRLTYRELTTGIDRLAFHFKKLGIQKDDIVMVQLPNIVETVVVFFAAARIGAIASPLAMAARDRELNHALALTEPVAIVTVNEFGEFNHLQMVQRAIERHPAVQHLILAGDRLDDSALSLEAMLAEAPGLTNANGLATEPSEPNDILTICWTSGTEADPKGVPRTHNHWISIAKLVVEGCLVQEGHNIHGTFPLINMAGIGGLLVPWVLTGGKFVLHHPFDADVFLQQLLKEDLYYTLMPPALLETLAKSDQARALVKTSIRVIASGSVPLPPWMVKYYQDNLGISIVNFFASNEGIGLFSGPRLFPDAEERAAYFPRFGGQGVALNISETVIGGLQSCLLDTRTREEIREAGVSGELCFKGPTIFSGYWKRDDLTAKAFSQEGYYRSGDLFSIEGENRDKYQFQGRYKDLIIRGGYNVSPEEVEVVVGGHPKIKEVAAVGYPDDRLGEKTCICVVPIADQTITLHEVTAFLETKGIARYKFPEKLELMNDLPRNALNKVLRRRLREMIRST